MDGQSRNKAVEIALKIKGKLTDKLDLTSKGQSIAPKIVSEIKPYVRAETEASPSDRSDQQP
jgi:hypothetical protein